MVLGCLGAEPLWIETVNYGPSSGPRDTEGEKVEIKTLVDITRFMR